MSLDELTQHYTSAEITTAWAHFRDTDRLLLIYCVAELCPAGQPASTPITTGRHPQFRKSIDDKITLYARREFVSPSDAVAFFRNTHGTHLPSTFLPQILIATPLLPFPPGEEALLIASNLVEDFGVGALLPRRPTCLRVMSKYDTQNSTRNLLNANQQKLITATMNGAVHCSTMEPFQNPSLFL